MILVVHLSYMAFNMLRYTPSLPILLSFHECMLNFIINLETSLIDDRAQECGQVFLYALSCILLHILKPFIQNFLCITLISKKLFLLKFIYQNTLISTAFQKETKGMLL